MSDDYAKIEVKRPCIEVDLSGACLNQAAIDMMIGLLRDSMTKYDIVDINIRKGLARSNSRLGS